ncbi:MAG: dihydroorotase [Patescibacteria group bacterium]|nr:dihydroorotase [Patescibacteria group bacterium]MDD5164486.1 dihydroorotase [Patescibacteria group bacterium]MDD5534136.1 dihydroorotase [Patescibacteria group bacterium]
MIIDPHVHCRDGKQAYKETIEHVFKIADEQGVNKIFDMPNTTPPILFEKDVKARLKLVPKNRKNDYYLYIGLTANRKQLKEAIKCYDKYREVIGFKLYAGKSAGNLAIISVKDQIKIYKTLSEFEYKGVLAVHCEKESFLKPKLWNPLKPITHCFARPKKAEIESVKDQIKFAKQTNFKGTLYICHVSCPESVELIDRARKEIKITCGVTPHHILWSNEMLKQPDGLLYTTNPPLRDKKDVKKLRKYLKDGKIDWIETDHAPHIIGEKLFSPYCPGYPSLYLYKNFTEKFLPSIGLSKKQIKKITFENIRKTFKII